ncbi:hypothetical protein D3C80_388510 [compost metagenome]
MNCILFGALAHFPHKVERERNGELDAPGPAGSFHKPQVALARAADFKRSGDDALCRLDRGCVVSIDIDRQGQHFLIPAAQHGECTVAGNGCPALRVIEIVGELCARLLLAIDHLGAENGAIAHMLAQAAEKIGIFGDGFGNDIARAIERRLQVGDFTLNIVLRKLCRVGVAIGPDGFGERAKATFAGDLGAGAALRLVGKIKVFEFGLGGGTGKLGRQFVGHLALGIDAVDDRDAAGFQLTQIDEALGEIAQLRIVEAASHFLTIARDEGNRRAFVQQTDRRLRLFRARVDFCGNRKAEFLDVGGHGSPRLDREARP